MVENTATVHTIVLYCLLSVPGGAEILQKRIRHANYAFFNLTVEKYYICET